MAILKPLLSKIWASGAVGSDLESPDTPKFASGWVAGEKPPNGQMNWLQWTLTKALAHLNEQGVLSWDTDTIYPLGAYVWSSGKVYRSRTLANTGNVVTLPTQWQEQSLPDMPTSGDGFILYYSGSKLFWKNHQDLDYGSYEGRVAASSLPLVIPNNNTLGNAPLASEVNIGELALNFKERALYSKSPEGQIIKLSGSASIVDSEFILTEGQTTVQPLGGYTVNQIEVFLLGRKLLKEDYVANDGINVTINEPGSAGDHMAVSVWGAFIVADTYTQLQTDTLLTVLRGERAGVGFDFYGDEITMLAQKGNTAVACNNQELIIADWQELFDNIGTTFDTFNGALAPTVGSFRAPPQEVGGLGLYNRGVGAINGPVGTYQEDVFKEHTHTQELSRVSGSTYAFGNGKESIGETLPKGDAVETRPRSLTVLKCVWTGK